MAIEMGTKPKLQSGLNDCILRGFQVFAVLIAYNLLVINAVQGQLSGSQPQNRTPQ